MTAENFTIANDYVVMPDGIRIAVSTWGLQSESYNQPLSAVLLVTRYWRTMAFTEHCPELQVHYPLAKVLSQHGYRLVVADARGTGASFGSRQAEVDQDEVNDIGELIKWISTQSWCDGNVATTGTSYAAITTLYSLVTAPSGLKVGVCRAPDFDMYRHLFAPGGVINHWFIQTWGQLTADQDANDVDAVFFGGYLPAPKSGNNQVLGVMPVDQDKDGQMLLAAVAEHKDNFNIASTESLDFIDDFLSEKNPPVYAPLYKSAIEKNNLPVVIRCGWHDAATALGALSMFATFSNPVHILLGPWNHVGSYLVDPFAVDSDSRATEIAMEETNRATVEIIKRVMGKHSEACIESANTGVSDNHQDHSLRKVDYFTLGENRWKTTSQWPLPTTTMQRLYLNADRQLSEYAPETDKGCDQYTVDASATTGRYNRWYAQAANQPVLFPDRKEENRKLLVYDMPPLQHDTEITGHPLVSLWMRSTTTDGQLFVYLESVDTDGRVRLLTEGQLRLLHRKVSSEATPYVMFGPYHSLKQKDAMPMVVGEVANISFDLLPISVLLQKGHHIRLSIAGADKDTFEPIEGCETPTLTLERNSQYLSYIDLPVIP